MALHTELTIYKDATALFALAMKVTTNMRRESKQLIGAKFRDECMEILHAVADANSVLGQEKVAFIDTLHKRLRGVEILMRLSRDQGLVPTSQYSQAIQLTQSIGRQAGGWRRKALAPVS